jgi:hypothetical protein
MPREVDLAHGELRERQRLSEVGEDPRRGLRELEVLAGLLPDLGQERRGGGRGLHP